MGAGLKKGKGLGDRAMGSGTARYKKQEVVTSLRGKANVGLFPLVMTGGLKFKEITHNAALCDVAPTALDVMGLPIPKDMTGQSLLAK
ncbi:hypothetical protein P5673_019232 [Acropora cervicornis]|uniref:Uncharacterized protein n=1 Tax=Acropora cervicornis TaxID=6130 RepID=A0AAD9V2M4_ACRCE|nr:hypothetical protein P5673_019232 [Acropora cervicornis]